MIYDPSVQRFGTPAAVASRLCSVLLRTFTRILLAFVVARASSAWAQIYAFNTSTVIPGTEGITPGPGVDLSGWNTLGHQLEFAVLNGVDLTNATFANSDLASAQLSYATLTNTNLANTNLTYALLGDSTLNNANFSGAVINGALFISETGFSASQLYSTASYASCDLTDIDLEYCELTGWNFVNQNLTNADLQGSTLNNANFTNANLTNAILGNATLTNANFSGAIVNGADFGNTTNFTASQLYSTASYASADLTGIGLSGDLTGWNFANQNLTNAYFENTTLTNAIFTGADLRGANYWMPGRTTITHNTIRPDGSIQGLALLAGEKLVIRNNPLAITVNTSATFDPTSTLQFLLDNNWTSPVGFSPGLTPALAGTLDLAIAQGADRAGLLGQTFQLFNWTGVSHTGTFALSSPYQWDQSQLYTTGNVTLLNLLIPGDFNDDGHVDAADILAMEQALADPMGYEADHHNLTDAQLLAIGDLNNDGQFTNADLQSLLNLLKSGGGSGGSVPEPSSLILAGMAGIALLGLFVKRKLT